MPESWPPVTRMPVMGGSKATVGAQARASTSDGRPVGALAGARWAETVVATASAAPNRANVVRVFDVMPLSGSRPLRIRTCRPEAAAGERSAQVIELEAL